MAALANLVRVVSSTTGTGTLTLGAAVSGFLNTTQAGMKDSAVYSYAIEADYVTVGDDSVPTSREVGTGTYTASGTTLSRTVVNSTNSNALLNLAGDAQVIIAILAGNIRELLTADRNYYVRTDGSDSNTGLVNSAGGAFLTLQAAYNLVTQTLDFGGRTVTINVGAGTYGTGLNLNSNWVGGGALIIQGDTGTPANVLVSTGSGQNFQVTADLTEGPVTVQGFKVVNDGTSYQFRLARWCDLSVTNMEFGATFYGFFAAAPGISVNATNYTISAGCNTHVFVSNGARVAHEAGTITLTGTPAWAGVYLQAQSGGLFRSTATFSGSATGTRYSISGGSSVDVAGAGTSYLPGNAAGSGGTTTGGGFYG